jgi:single-strand DNA-binding protein
MNKAILMGRLTKDPELKYTTTTNMAVCNFTLAVNRRFAKEGQQKADFINIVTWNKTAEFCSKWFKKGQQVAVVGSIQTRTWDDNDGKKHYQTDVVADEAYFAEGKRDSGDSHDSYEQPPQNNPAQTAPGFNAPGFNAPKQNDLPPMFPNDGFYPIDDDQLPF